MFTIRKTFRFEMAHQLSAASSRCCVETIHGHSYTAEVFLGRSDVDSKGMVADFGDLQAARDLFDSLDHALLIPTAFTSEYKDMLSQFNKKMVLTPWNPTAENLARWAFLELKTAPFGAFVFKVRIHETTTGWAEYEEDDYRSLR